MNNIGFTRLAHSRLASLRLVGNRVARFGRSDFVRRLHRQKPAIVGEIILFAIILAAIFAPFIAPYPLGGISVDTLEAPSWAHLFGTDELGRDILSRVLHGARVSLGIALTAVLLGVVPGVALGLIAGYRGGTWIDQALMALLDAWRAFPSLILALALVATLGASIRNVIIAIVVVEMPSFSRLTRGQVLSSRENDYVMAARAMGAGPSRIMWRHIFPNIVAPLIVMAVVMVASAILVEASLSFLGLGVQPPNPSLGSMVRNGYPLLKAAPWYALIPGVAIFVTVLGAMLFGNGLRDAFDPTRRSR